jgi:hypothetical protein
LPVLRENPLRKRRTERVVDEPMTQLDHSSQHDQQVVFDRQRTTELHGSEEEHEGDETGDYDGGLALLSMEVRSL